jgi:hypothetical protein
MWSLERDFCNDECKYNDFVWEEEKEPPLSNGAAVRAMKDDDTTQ